MKTLDFDKFMQEKNHETITVTVFGKNYLVPAKIPAIVPVMMARSEASDDKQLATKMVMRAADAMFGANAVDEMCANGMSAEGLAELIQRLFAKINGDNDENESEEYTDEESRKTASNGGNAKK